MITILPVIKIMFSDDGCFFFTAFMGTLSLCTCCHRHPAGSNPCLLWFSLIKVNIFGFWTIKTLLKEVNRDISQHIMTLFRPNDQWVDRENGLKMICWDRLAALYSHTNQSSCPVCVRTNFNDVGVWTNRWPPISAFFSFPLTLLKPDKSFEINTKIHCS